ncbi:MAG: polyprenyl diphosphate synthase [Candidatus Diapherotrites archaeon]
MTERRYHIGMIPDGNRRWAALHEMHPSLGHAKGAEKMELFLKWALKKQDIGEISIYGLSEENFKRTKEELNWLYGIYYKRLNQLLEEDIIHQEKVRVNFVSTKEDKVPTKITDVFNEIKSETKFYGNKILNILIGYTGQSEILRAVSSPMNRVKNLFFGLNEKDLEKHLAIQHSCDFVIRTGEEEKAREAKSGFLLWQAAYAEYYHINKFFPDLEINDLEEAWSYFKNTRRRKGT